MRVLISGGGTSGHVNPAIAIANELRERDKNIQVAFAGTEKGIENKLVPREGYKLYHLKVKGFKRKISLENIDALIKAFTSQITAKKIIRDFNPDIVIGTGGYVSWPVLSCAAKMKIPTIIHEQNAFPGVTTKMLAKVVDVTMISFEESKRYFKEKDNLVYTGNPVRREFFNIDHKTAKKDLSPGKPMILSYGGSMGAHKMNEVIIEFMDEFSKKKNVTHYHATGSLGYKEFSELFMDKGLDVYKNLFLSEYLFDIHKYMAAADIIICRAGALTLAELAIMKKTAILVPSPYVAENHQYKNAAVLEQARAAVIIEEKDLTVDALISKVEEFVNDPLKISDMARNIGEYASVDTLDKIYDIVIETASKRDAK